MMEGGTSRLIMFLVVINNGSFKFRTLSIDFKSIKKLLVYDINY